MRTIHKHTLMVTDAQRIATHRGAIPRAVGEQNGRVALWMEVDTDAPIVERVAYIVGTGNPMPKDEMTYVGTSVGERYVWHVYLGEEL